LGGNHFYKKLFSKDQLNVTKKISPGEIAFHLSGDFGWRFAYLGDPFFSYKKVFESARRSGASKELAREIAGKIITRKIHRLSQ